MDHRAELMRKVQPMHADYIHANILSPQEAVELSRSGSIALAADILSKASAARRKNLLSDAAFDAVTELLAKCAE